MENPVLLVLLIAAGVLSLRFFYSLCCRISAGPGDNISTAKYGWPDAILASALALLFLSMIWSSMGERGEITRDTILRGSMVWGLLITAILTFLILRHISPLAVFGLRAAGLPRALLTGIGWLAVAYPLILLAQALSYSLMADSAVPQDVVQFLADNTGWQDRGAVILLAVVIAPVAEELIFRGYFYGVLRKYSGRFWAVAITSFLFAGIHGHLPSLTGLLILGVVLALIYERTSNLWVPIAAHSFFNGISICMAIFWPWMLE